VTERVAVQMVIRLWRRSSESAYLLEFQRRNGCVVTFYNFFNAAQQALGPLLGQQTTVQQQQQQPQPQQHYEVPLAPGGPLDLSAGEPGTGAITLDEQTFALLGGMCAVDDSDALRVLVSATSASARAEQNQAFLLAAPAASGRSSPSSKTSTASSSSSTSSSSRRSSTGAPRVLPLLSQCLRSPSSEMQCFGSKLLHSLAKSASTAAKRQLMSGLIVAAMGLLERSTQSSNRSGSSGFAPVSNSEGGSRTADALMLRDTQRVVAAALLLLSPAASEADRAVLSKHSKQIEQLRLSVPSSSFSHSVQSIGL